MNSLTKKESHKFKATSSTGFPREKIGNSADYSSAPDAKAIIKACDRVQRLLIEKNASYGASATNPVRIFSRGSSEEQLLTRIDDKLSRVARAHENALGEDTVLDLIGYLVLLLVVRDQAD